MKKSLELDFGFGTLEVMQGCHKDRYSLAIGKNGNGIIGESISKDRYLKEDESCALCTLTILQALMLSLIHI